MVKNNVCSLIREKNCEGKQGNTSSRLLVFLVISTIKKCLIPEEKSIIVNKAGCYY